MRTFRPYSLNKKHKYFNTFGAICTKIGGEKHVRRRGGRMGRRGRRLVRRLEIERNKMEGKIMAKKKGRKQGKGKKQN